MTKKKEDKDEWRKSRPQVFFKNYDYTEEGPNETSPGGGLYHGYMGKYKSVKEFVEKRRKDTEKFRRDASAVRLSIFRDMLSNEES